MPGQDGNSLYFQVKGSGKKPYTITINYDTGHWCTCRGMISKKGTYGEDAGRTQGTSCKHVKDIIRDKFGDDWGVSGGIGQPRTPRTVFNPAVAGASPSSTPSEPTGRRAAILAQRARAAERERVESPSVTLPLRERIASLREARGSVS
jgi:hypothetical protein